MDMVVPQKSTTVIGGATALLQRAQREFECGHLRDAIGLLEQAIRLELDTVQVRTMLGIAHARLRQVDRAFEHLEHAVAADTGAFGPRCALGELYLRLCIPEKAFEHLQRALECAQNVQERTYVETLLREERARDRKRLPRPSFRQPFWRPRRRRTPKGDA
jgi:tetratricopeptide (TPR) repeat protein